MPRVVLARHADVENPDGIFYGHLESFGLSEIGRRQAGALGRVLGEMGVRRIVHSPLRRARETAEIAADAMGANVELEVDEALLEALFGRYLQGVPYWQVPFRRPLWLVHRLRRGLLPNDETIAAMGKRVLNVAKRLVHESPESVTACISHGDPLQAAWVLLERRPQTERELGRKRVERAGMMVVTWPDRAARPEAHDEASVAYLPPAIPP